jgi:hypothetical protein
LTAAPPGQRQLRYLALAGDVECSRNIWIGGCEFQWDVILPGYVGKDGTGKHVSPLGLQHDHLAQKRASIFPRTGNADKQCGFHVVGLNVDMSRGLRLASQAAEKR